MKDGYTNRFAYDPTRIAAIEARVVKEIADHEARQHRRSKQPSAVILQFKRSEVTR